MANQKDKETAAHWEWTLPSSWTWVRISDIADVIGGGTPHTTRYEFWEGGDISWITPADLSGFTQREISTGKRNITQAGLENSSARLLPPRSVLFSSRAPIGYVAIAANPLATNQGFKNFVVSEGIMPEYVYFYLQRAKHEITKLASGTTFPEISARKTASIPIPIAPTSEQEHIVNKLDALLSRVAVGEAAARRALDRLQRYRVAVLHAAVTGELTRDWRKTHKPDETGTLLLEHLLQERRAHWEDAELKRLQVAGKQPEGDNWKERYPEPTVPKTTDLPDSPPGWVWAGWEQVGFSQNGRPFPSKEYTKNGVKLLRPGNLFPDGSVQWNEINIRCLPPKFEHENPEHVIGGNELVMNLTAQSLKDEFLGRVCLTSSGEHCLLNQRLARLTPVSGDPKFFLYVFKSPMFRRFVEDLNSGSLIQHMFTSQLGEFAFPLPPVAEQIEIVRQVERKLESGARLAAVLNRQLERAGATRQSLLREAFAGKLAPQNHKDEPASLLLERIRASREVEAQKPKPKRMPKSNTKPTRRPLIDVLKEQKTPITPEQLFRVAGFQPAEADSFYRELATLRKKLRETKPNGVDAKAWPLRARVLLQLKED